MMSTFDADPNMPKDQSDLANFDLPIEKAYELQDLRAQREQLHAKAVESVESEIKADIEVEDGEVFSEDSSSDGYSTPVCRFYLRNNCFWGSNCRFKHPGALDAPKYDMFDRVQPPSMPLSMYMPAETERINMPLPLPLPQPDCIDYPPAVKGDLENSFNTSLQNLKQVMRKAGYKIRTQNLRRTVHAPWVQFNDLDTDPYYSHRDEATAPIVKQESPLPLPSLPRQGRASADNRRKSAGLRLSRASSTSSSSTPDYTTTTDSSSSSSSASPLHCKVRPKSLRKRKLLLSPKSPAKRFRKTQTAPKTPTKCLWKTTHSRPHLLHSSCSSSELSSLSSTHATESSTSSTEHSYKHATLSSQMRAKYCGKTCLNRKTYRQYLKERLRILDRKIAKATAKLK